MDEARAKNPDSLKSKPRMNLIGSTRLALALSTVLPAFMPSSAAASEGGAEVNVDTEAQFVIGNGCNPFRKKNGGIKMRFIDEMQNGHDHGHEDEGEDEHDHEKGGEVDCHGHSDRMLVGSVLIASDSEDFEQPKLEGPMKGADVNSEHEHRRLEIKLGGLKEVKYGWGIGGSLSLAMPKDFANGQYQAGVGAIGVYHSKMEDGWKPPNHEIIAMGRVRFPLNKAEGEIVSSSEWYVAYAARALNRLMIGGLMMGENSQNNKNLALGLKTVLVFDRWGLFAEIGGGPRFAKDEGGNNTYEGIGVHAHGGVYVNLRGMGGHPHT